MRRAIFWLLRLGGGAVVFAAALLVWDGLHDEVAGADIGVVLGNTVRPDGTPSPRLAARLDRALELYREGRFPLVLVSGGVGREGWDEAKVMGEYLVHGGVPASAVIVDSEGVTTWATALKTKAVMQERHLGSALVVTQYYHIPRSVLALRRGGVSPVYSAHARFFEWRDLYSIPREIVGYARYALRFPRDRPREAAADSPRL